MELENINAKANAGLTTGIIGTAGLLLGGLGAGLFGMHNGMYRNGGSDYVTKSELEYSQQLAAKDSQIAILTSEQNTEVKIADVYERLITRINADQRAQSEWNANQSVLNAQMSAAIATNTNSIAALKSVCDDLTKIVIPIDNVCPKPMSQFNSWTAPTTAATPTV